MKYIMKSNSKQKAILSNENENFLNLNKNLNENLLNANKNLIKIEQEKTSLEQPGVQKFFLN